MSVDSSLHFVSVNDHSRIHHILPVRRITSISLGKNQKHFNEIDVDYSFCITIEYEIFICPHFNEQIHTHEKTCHCSYQPTTKKNTEIVLVQRQVNWSTLVFASNAHVYNWLNGLIYIHPHGKQICVKVFHAVRLDATVTTRSPNEHLIKSFSIHEHDVDSNPLTSDNQQQINLNKKPITTTVTRHQSNALDGNIYT
jgi:hypothetical protein